VSPEQACSALQGGLYGINIVLFTRCLPANNLFPLQIFRYVFVVISPVLLLRVFSCDSNWLQCHSYVLLALVKHFLLCASAWFLSFHVIIYAFASFMPVVWYLLWAGIAFGLGFAFRSDQSLWGFYLWDVTIILLRALFYAAYILYYLNTMTAELFPFYFFSHKWRMSSPRWFPLNSRNLNSLNDVALCERCDRFIIKSKLIMGSSLYLTRLVEWHDF
jgi:hypothetical protein